MTLDSHMRNPFEGRDAEADEERVLATANDPLVKELVQEYARIWKIIDACSDLGPVDRAQRYADDLTSLPAPTPMQIDAVLQSLAGCVDAGLYLTGLLRRAAVHQKQFALYLKTPVHSLAAYFKPTERVCLRIQGDVGAECSSHENCDIYVDGNADRDFGDGSRHCTYELHGNAGRSFGCGHNSKYIVHGDVLDEWLPGSLCVYEFHGSIGRMIHPGTDRSFVIRVPREKLEETRKRPDLFMVEALP